ncbi:MAG: biotin--[acetyl-CoA-carboxylase] ligase [Ginsengibacter sp.]
MAKLNMIILQNVDSTNNYAMELIQKNSITSGTGVFALHQTDGKGRRGKGWKAMPGQNILLSTVTEMTWQPVSEQFQLSVAVALACRNFISTYVNERVCVKWPNDIFIDDSKAAGVLIENVIKGTLWQWAVIGTGININQDEFEEVDANVTSLKKQTGKEYDVLKLAEDLKTAILQQIKNLKEGKFDQMLLEYNQHLYAKDQLVKLKKGNVVFETTIHSVSASGQLITSDVMERQFSFDEVTFRGLV